MMSKHFIKEFRRDMTVFGLKGFQWVIGNMPRWCLKTIRVILMPIGFWGIKRLKKIVARNYQAVYGEFKNQNEYDSVTKRFFKNISQCMLDVLYFVERPAELAKVTRIYNEEYLQEALKEGRGVIAISAHFGNFPLMFQSLTQKGYRVNVIIRPMRNAEFSKFMYDLCAKWDINMIQTFPRKKFIRESLGALKRNELLFFLLDEIAPQESGVKVEFFDNPVMRAIGPLLFHERKGSPIIPMFIAQDRNKEFEIFIEEALNVETRFDDDKNNVRNISHLTNTIESFVRKYPFQWGGWLNKRWHLQ